MSKVMKFYATPECRGEQKVRSCFLYLAVVVIFAGHNSALAQSDGDAFSIGTWRELHSEVLDEKRRIIVSTPSGYASNDKKYGVIYLLDGNGHFNHTTGVVDFMVGNNQIPDMLVVAVTNTNRTRDLTPPFADKNSQPEGSGGADNFIKFFQQELIPFVDKNYRTRPYRILIGHSYGGLFAMHTLTHHPDTFDGYIAISPSLQWDDQQLVGKAETFFHETPVLRKSLYMTSGDEGGQLTGGVLKVAGILEERAPKDFEWDSRIMEEETHGTVPYRSTLQGLEFIFQDWTIEDPVALYEMGGTSAIYKKLARSEERFGLSQTNIGPTFFSLCVALIRSGRLEDATRVLEHAPEVLHPSAMLYSMIGKAYLDREERDKATSAYEMAMQLNPRFSDAADAWKKLDIDPSKSIKAIELTDDALRAFAGTYEMPGEADQVEVTVEANSLFVESTGQAKTELFAVSDTEFVIASDIYKLAFKRNESGEITGLTFHRVDGKRYEYSPLSDDATNVDE